MDKNAIKKYAVWARRELIEHVAKKAQQYGIEENTQVDAEADSINGALLTPTEKKERKALIAQIKDKGYEQVMEEVAYIWFNRFSALRFMEVNGYLPTHVRVFTDKDNNFKPQILAEAIHLELDGIDMEKVYEFKDANKTDELYKYLLITQCNALNAILPGVFQKIADYTELLLPDNLLREGSVIEQMIALIPEEDWKDAVQIIGWLYQYYCSEKHNEIINIYKGTIKKEDIPAATQLFTTDWVVRYMVDNSLGRYWIERNPESKLAEKLDFFATPKNGEIHYINEKIQPQDLTFFDPCMGSGHILVYAFDVLMEIYRECGYADRDAALNIVQFNLFGIDIDVRAYQLAYFAVMMKARSYNRRALTQGVWNNLVGIEESNNLSRFECDGLTNNIIQNGIGNYLIDIFKDAKEIGSLQTVKVEDYKAFAEYLLNIQNTKGQLNMDDTLWIQDILPQMLHLTKQAHILSNKFAVVCTNPPYMNKLESNLKDFVVKNYKAYSTDLFGVFMYRNFDFCKHEGYSAFMTPVVWMSIKSYYELRDYIVKNKMITTLIQFEYSAFEEATVPICSFVMQNCHSKSNGVYFNLSDFVGGMDKQKEKTLEAIANPHCSYYFEANQENFAYIPSTPITAYWVSDNLIKLYEHPLIKSQFSAKEGVGTRNDDVFLKMHWEVENTKIGKDKRWILTDKAGGYRKWHLGATYVMDWEDNGVRIKNYRNEDGSLRSRPQNIQYLFRPGISWGKIGSGASSFRYREFGYGFNDAAPTLFGDDSFPLLAALNTNIYRLLLKIRGGTLNMTCGVIEELPLLGYDTEELKIQIKEMVEKNIFLSKEDWDSFETSWDFVCQPLIPSSRDKQEQLGSQFANSRMEKFGRLSWHFDNWTRECDERFNNLKANEEELNRIFIDVYGLQDELNPEVEDKDVTVRKADLQRDIKSLISYAVGCMFGRYSLDEDGLVYAGGEWNSMKYRSFEADKENIIPICDDEYFEDDIVGRFVKFVEVVYGEDTVQENLKFIADALGGKGQPIEVIRNYFMNDFFNDHCKMYQKRPIYWQFDSGKKNGFKCLIYMHRYQPDTIMRIRTDYVHEQQSRYRTALTDLENRIASASTSERVKLNKQLSTLQAQIDEIHSYEEKIHHLADQMIRIDLDDGVKNNYVIFRDVLAKIK